MLERKEQSADHVSNLMFLPRDRLGCYSQYAFSEGGMGAWPCAGPGITSPGVWGQQSPAFGKCASIFRGAARSPGVRTPAPRISAHETSRVRRLRSRRLPPTEAAGSGRAGREAGCRPSGSPTSAPPAAGLCKPQPLPRRGRASPLSGALVSFACMRFYIPQRCF